MISSISVDSKWHKRFTYKVATLTFKALHHHQPTYQLLNIYSPTRQLRSSGAGLLVKHETSNKTSDRAFAVAAATAWNRLLPKVRTATSTEQFSCALKAHLFTLDWSRGWPRRLWLVISTHELWRRIQIEWLTIDWQLTPHHEQLNSYTSIQQLVCSV